MGCNAALGVNTSITTDSSGEYGQFKYIIVCQTATPVVVAPVNDLPVAVAAASAPVEAYAKPMEPYVNY